MGRVFLVACTAMLAAAACAGGGSSGGGSGSTLGPNASAVGLGSYTLTAGQAGSVAIELLGKGGGPRGSVVIAPGPSGYVATSTAGGATATERGYTVTADGGGTWSIQERMVGNAVLRTEVLFDAAGEVVSEGLSAPLPAGVVPDLGALRETATGRWGVLPLVGPGVDVVGAVSPADWLVAVGAQGVVGSEASLLLTAALSDPALVDAVLQHLVDPPTASGTRRGALHTSDTCRDLYAKAKGSTHPCCTQCLDTTKDTLSGVQTLLTLLGGIEVVLETRKGCMCCKKKLNLDMAEIVTCVESVLASQKTAIECAAQSVQPWEVAQLSKDGHNCVVGCDADRCEAHCKSHFGVDVAICARGQCVCAVKAGVCEEVYGEANCSDYLFVNVNEQDIVCVTAKCGDGKVTPVCSTRPERSETCDPTVYTKGCRCGADCQKCEVCECDPKTTDGLPSGKYCDANCALKDLPPCEDSLFDYFISKGKWCDPKASAAWCTKGTTCSATKCRCEAEPKPGATQSGLTLTITLRNTSSEDHVRFRFPNHGGFDIRVDQGATQTATVKDVSPGDSIQVTVSKPSPDGPVAAGSTNCVVTASPSAPTVTYSGSLSCFGF